MHSGLAPGISSRLSGGLTLYPTHADVNSAEIQNLGLVSSFLLSQRTAVSVQMNLHFIRNNYINIYFLILENLVSAPPANLRSGVLGRPIYFNFMYFLNEYSPDMFIC